MATDASRPLAALFDLDGVIFDTEPIYTGFWKDIANRYCPDIPNFENIIKGTTLDSIFSKYFPDKNVQEKISSMLLDFESSMPFVYIPGTREAIEDLSSNNVRMAIVTSSDMTKMRSVIAAHPEIEDLFDVILTAESFERSKPDPDCYLKGAQAFSAPLANCMVFEDSVNGLAAGRNSGIFTVGLATTNKKETICDLCDYICDDLTGFTFKKMYNLLQNR